jgi:hypothetical protein
MDKADATEAAAIAIRILQNLAKTVPPAGRAGADARNIIGETSANAYVWLRMDSFGPPFSNCFWLTWQAGATFPEIEVVRRFAEQEQPQTVGGILLKNGGINLCLVTMSRIIAGMSFVSRQDVEMIREQIQEPFNESIETSADEMDQQTFQGIVSLYAAITNHLVTTARPLPRMLGYQFAQSLSTLVIAYKLYDDASRGDEILNENKIVHPLFCLMRGMALSVA